MNRITYLFLPVVLVALAGCATPSVGGIASSMVSNKVANGVMGNEELRNNPPGEWVVTGQTRMDEVKAAYGEPFRSKTLDDGREAWMYVDMHEERNTASYIPGVRLVAGERKHNSAAYQFLFQADGTLGSWRKEAYSEDDRFWRGSDEQRTSEAH